MLFPPFLYKKKGDTIIPGQFFRALVWNNKNFVHDQLRVYADRTIASTYLLGNLTAQRLYKHVSKFMPQITLKDCMRPMGQSTDENLNAISFADFKYLISIKGVTMDWNGPVRIEFMGDPLTEDFYLVDVNMKISDDDFIKSIEDVFCNLNNKPTTLRKCMNALCDFLQAPQQEKDLYRKKLQIAYLNVPKYQRRDIYPLSIDLEGKTPIEDIIFKRDTRFDNYGAFVNVYGDDFFETKYTKKNMSTIYN